MRDLFNIIMTPICGIVFMFVTLGLFLRYRGRIPREKAVEIRPSMLALLDESSFSISPKIHKENLDFLYKLASKRAGDYRVVADNIDRKAGTALALMGIASASFFFSQEFTSLESLSQVWSVFVFLIVAYFLLRALSNNNFREPLTNEIIEHNTQKDIRDIKIELLQMHHECDRKNQRLLKCKQDAYNTALIIATIFLALFLIFTAVLADKALDENNLLKTLLIVIIIALIIGLVDILKSLADSEQHRRRLERMFFRD